MRNAASIFRFLIECADRGERAALVTITGVIGSSSRTVGTHMAVGETGLSAGTISSGCVEAAIVAEALRIIETGRSATIRFGAGSPYIDIRLPCGGGLDLLIIPQPCRGVMGAALARLEERRPVLLSLSHQGELGLVDGAVTPSTRSTAFVALHEPDLRLFVIGHGAETSALTRLALTLGAEVTVLSPDANLVTALGVAGATAHLLKTNGRSAHLRTDPYSAVVFLFHDHDWEHSLLSQALEQRPFFIGAMGSRATHIQRLDGLRGKGVSRTDLLRITGPIGVIPSARDPATLSLSVLAQVVERLQVSCGAEPQASSAGTDADGAGEASAVNKTHLTPSRGAPKPIQPW